MQTSSGAKVHAPHNFHTRAQEIKPLKSDINNLIMDYLTAEGYPCAAAKFSKEANVLPHQDDVSIRARHEIQHSIHSGDIQAAIDALNDLEPEVLDRNASLHFDLLRLQLVELIRDCNSKPQGDITPALTFAAEQLAPRAPNNDRFMEDLEKTMTLLVFPSDKLEPSLTALLEPTLRKTVADNVNKAILAQQKTRRIATIRNLIKLRAWAEDTARSQKLDLPARLSLDLDGNQEVESEET